jgi:hypothetical protein
MKRAIATFVLAGGLALPGLPSLAADPPPEQRPTAQAQKERLEARSKVLERRIHRPVAVGGRGASATAGVARRASLRRQQREIEALIQRLEAGENVAPSEVERLLEGR